MVTLQPVLKITCKALKLTLSDYQEPCPTYLIFTEVIKLVYGYKHLNKKSVSLAEPKNNIFSRANF